MKKEIKRVKRERVYQGTIVDVYKDYMEFSNGNHEVWDYIHHKGAAAVIPVMDDGRLRDGKTVPECTGSLYTGASGRRAGPSG